METAQGALAYHNQLQSQNTLDSGSTFGDILGTLGGLYLTNQNVNNLQQGQGNINSQISSLQDMYNPNGVVAQQMAQQMAAKDAAAGRNSQYGLRSAALQAQLAAGASRNAQTIGQLQTQQNQQSNQQTAIQGQQLASLFNLGNKTGATQWAGNQLSGLFGNNQPNTGINPVNSSDNSFLHSGVGYGDTTPNPTSSYTGGFSATQPTDNSLGSGQYGMQAPQNSMTTPQQFGSGAGTNFLNTDNMSGNSGNWFNQS